MSILDNFPHSAVARTRTRTRGDLGGSKDSFTAVFVGRACWQQQASNREIREFEKRGIDVTDKIYFLTDPELDERHILVVSGTSGTSTYEVASKSDPDASAGLGVVYKVMCKKTTTGSTETEG